MDHVGTKKPYIADSVVISEGSVMGIASGWNIKKAVFTGVNIDIVALT